jgi:dTDP-4-amino-4,6-dideoxygalactose transaminase
MKIQMTDLKVQYDAIKSEIDTAINGVISDSAFILGDRVNLFEQEIAAYYGVNFAVGVASGTDALVLALESLELGQGDEVITTPFTFIATSEAISRVGARPVFCDIEYDTLNIDPAKIKEKITPKTKAILPVHLYGLSCKMDEICSIAGKHNIKIIEDCAQSFGSEYQGKKTGTFGDCGTLSFFPAKTLGCFGDGGMIITNDEEIAKKIKMLRNHGSTKKYYYGMHGFNSRLDSLQAAILRVKLKYIDEWINKRMSNAQYYNELLSDIQGLNTPVIPKDLKHTFNYYTVRIKNNKRQSVQEKLSSQGIAFAVSYPLSLHLQDVYKSLGYIKGDFPISEQAQEEVLSLPMYPELEKDQIKHIVKSIKEAL